VVEGNVILPGFIKKPVRVVFQKTVQLNVALQRRKYQYVFVLAHMRSGSTLLSHILTSHPDFVGAGETHTCYTTAADIKKLVPRTCELLRTVNLDAKYVVDKITMDQYLTDKVLSTLPIVGSLIIIRNPEAALKSIISLFQWKEAMALDHYVSRLETLGRYGEILRDRALFVEYDDLVDRPHETLAAITRFFKANPAFSSNYVRTKITGKMGDPSSNIFEGRIFRTRDHEIQITSSALAEAVSAFQKCRSKLSLAGVPSANSRESA
jgi:hypothetical protein